MSARLPIVIVVILILLGLGAWWFLRPPLPIDPEPNDSNQVLPPPERLAELVSLLETGVAQLENGQYNLCIETFELIAEELPNEPAPVRNIAIARLMGSDQTPSALQNILETMDQLERLEPGSLAFARLYAEALAQQGNTTQAIDEFEQAANLAPTDPRWKFAMYEISQRSRNEEDLRRGAKALQAALDLQPDNIVLAIAQAMQLTSERKPDVVDSLATIERLARPAARYIESQLSSQGITIASIRAAAEAGEWNRVEIPLRFLNNVIVAHDLWKSDAVRLDKPLASVIPVVILPRDLILTEFSSQVMDKVPAPSAPPREPIPVNFSSTLISEGVQVPLPLHDLAVVDVNLDGRLDLCLLGRGSFQVLFGTDSGTWEFGEAYDLPGEFERMIAQDMDNDKEIPFSETVLSMARGVPSDAATADIDFILVGPSGIVGLETVLDPQSRACTFQIRELQPVPGEVVACGAVIAGDFDADGDLDLCVDTEQGTVILWNHENWNFVPQSGEEYQLPADFRWRHAVAVDVDRDLDMDILLVGSDGVVGMLENLRHHEFVWRELIHSDSEPLPFGPLAVLDFDGNASWDLLTAVTSGVRLTPSRTLARGRLEWDSPRILLPGQLPEGLLLWDYDNDGHLDLLTWTGNDLALHRNAPEGFEPITLSKDILWDGIAAAVTGDIDLDGDLDLIVAEASGVRILVNEGGNSNRWVDLVFTSEFAEGDGKGVGTGRINNNAVGSVVEVRTPGNYQARIVEGQRTHFGLGPAEEIDVIRVTWTNGASQNYLEAKPLQVIAERQTIVTSCPYLYAWNGNEFVFVTDLLWAAPLGLPSPEGGVIPDRPWEYIKIPGEMLQADAGVYRLQITEELWEAAYLDEVRLVAVDHPEGVEVFTNEKVGPPAVAEPRLYTVSEPRVPIRAVNHRGEDVLEAISSADDHYLMLHHERHMQGYTEETALELDLGEIPEGASLVLYLTGWIRPTDANLNVRLQQNEVLPGPQPPRVLIPDAAGTWREIIPYMGFPGGKTKTIAVPIPNEFPPGDHRLRIETSMELYWDHIFFTADEPAITLREIPLTLLHADLHYRGVSALMAHSHHGPERYDYGVVATEPRFAPMEGRFTRYGDVTELLQATDHRMVVFGCGDELTLEFAVPAEPLEPGWVRDFVLYNVGWDKDCNLNGLLGQSSEPYPFVGMSGYPYPPHEAPWDTDDEYLRRWQTREMPQAPYLKFVHRFDRNSPSADHSAFVRSQVD